MNLKNSFYSLSIIERTEASVTAQVSFEAEHDIIKDHYPDPHIETGVCQFHIVKETLQDLLQKKIRISSVANVKYLQLMTPDTVCKLLINWSLNDDNLTIKSEYKNETSFSKMNLKGRVEN